MFVRYIVTIFDNSCFRRKFFETARKLLVLSIAHCVTRSVVQPSQEESIGVWQPYPLGMGMVSQWLATVCIAQRFFMICINLCFGFY